MTTSLIVEVRCMRWKRNLMRFICWVWKSGALMEHLDLHVHVNRGGGRRQDNLSHFQMFQTVSKFIIGIKDIISGLLRKHLAHDQLPSSSLHMNFTAVVGQFKEIFILDFLTCTIMSR